MKFRTPLETAARLFTARSVQALTVCLCLFGTVFCGAPARDIKAKAEVRSESVPEPLPAQSSDVIAEWNLSAVTLTLLPAHNLTPVQQARAMAMVQVSVHDAVNGITRRYETYLPSGQAPAGASPEAAAIAAAYRALDSLFGNGPFAALGNKTLSQVFSESLAAHGLSSGDAGIGYGFSAANAIIAARANDGAAQAQFPYDGPSTAPGVWRLLPGQTAQLPGWGLVTPWVLKSGSQFRPEAPPALDSEQYARDYNEIQIIGAQNSSTRTAEQTQIALFWRASPTAIWNPVYAQVAATQNLDLSEAARDLGLLYLATADASIACWDAKYTYNNWRPMPAIRNGDLDGNDATSGDPTWAPLLPTPNHPEYPSGHTANSGAMGEMLNLMFGDDSGVPLTVTVGGITRNWANVDQGIEEVINARVYSGIHFRNSDVVGARLGRQVAHFVLTHALRPCKGRGARCQ